MCVNKGIKLIAATTFTLITGAAQATVVELAVNGGFETGDFSDWTQFPGGGTQTITTVNPASGIYAGNLNLQAGPSNNVLKQANLGVGQLVPGQEITISWDMRGTLTDGGVLFVENFSELSGGGVSNNDLRTYSSLTSDWTHYEITTLLGADVSGGYTLQFAAVCGASSTCITDLYLDNISITADVSAVPVPAAVWLFGSGLIGLIGLARKKKHVLRISA